MSERTNPGTTLQTAEKIQAWLISHLAETRGLTPQSIDIRERFSRYGLDSQGAAGLLAALSQALGRPLPATLVWEQPTIEALSRYLSGAAAGSSATLHETARLPSAGEPVAVIGLSCRFPKAPNPEAFWRLLRDGVDAITEVPSDRWDMSALYDADLRAPGKMATRWGGFLEQVDQFDPQFFGISPREAVEMDPQQRLMLELSFEALHDAGVRVDRLKGSRTGVFLGAMWSDYARLPGGRLDAIVQHTATGQDLSIIGSGLLHAWPPGAQRRGQHRLLVLSRRPSPRVSEPAQRRDDARPRRRREPHPRPREHHRDVQVRGHVAGWSLQSL